MRRSVSFFIFLFFMTHNLVFANSKGYKMDIVESNDSYMIVDVQFDSLQVVQRQVDSKWYSDVHINGCAFTDKEDLPKLPVTSLVLGIPAVGEPALTVQSESTTSKNLGKIIPVPTQDVFAEKNNNSTINAIESSGWYPAEIASIGIDGFMRNQRIVQIQLNPVRFHNSTQMTQIINSLQLRIDFKKDRSSNYVSYALKAAPKDDFETVYSSKVSNYSNAQKWRVSPQGKTGVTSIESADSPYKYKLTVKDDGVYKVTGQDLINNGVDLNTINPSTLALSNKGNPVPIMVEGWADNKFDKEDRIIFIGQHNKGTNTYFDFYSSVNEYILTWGNGVGARFTEVSGVAPNGSDTTNIALTNVHLEYDVIYERLLVTPEVELDHWFWQVLNMGDEFPFGFPSTRLVPEKPVRVQIGMHGLSYVAGSPDHRVYFKMNEKLEGEARWDDQRPYVLDTGFFVPQNVEEINELQISLPGGLFEVGIDQICLNWMEFDFYERLVAKNNWITFKRQDESDAVLRIDGFTTVDQPYVFSTAGFAITNSKVIYDGNSYSLLFSTPKNKTDRYYVCTEDKFQSVRKIQKIGEPVLKLTSNGADYIIITHPNFMDQARKLADYRSAQNLRTKIVDINDIYNEFNYGLYSPVAIQRFVKYAYENWVKPAPLYLLIIGDTTHRMNKDSADDRVYPTFVPSMLEFTHSWGMTSSDNYFVAVSGDDYMPDLFVGRIPANNQSEAETMVQKIIDYETKSIIGDWRRNVYLLSGNDPFFETSSQYLYDNLIPKRYITNRLSTLNGSEFFGSTQDVADQFNAGQSIVNFIGHGGGGVFFDSQLFLSKDVERLENKDKYPVAFSMTCFIGHFDNPDMPSLAEDLMRAPNAGIAAHFGSAGRAYLFGDYFLNNSLFDAVFNQHATTIGEVTTMGKLGMVQQTQGYFDQVKNYILMGDPAMRINVVPDDLELTLSKDLLKSGDVLTVSGKVSSTSSGTVFVSVFNESDSLLVKKETTLQNGQFSIDALTLSTEMLQSWPDGGGQGMVRVYYAGQEHDGASVANFVVNQPKIPTIAINPPAPIEMEEFFFSCEIDQADYASVGGIESAQLQWSVNGVQWNELSVTNKSENYWTTLEPVQKPEGTLIYYKLLLVANDGSSSESEIFTFRIGYRPDVYFIPESITVSGSSTPILTATLRNNGGKDTGQFSLAFFQGEDTDNGTQISQNIVISNLASKTDTTLSIIWENAKAGVNHLFIKTDIDNQIVETNETNNLTQKVLMIATVENGSSGKLFSPKNSFYVEMPSGSVNENLALMLKQQNESKYLTVAEKLSLTPILLQGEEEWTVCSIVFQDSAKATTKPVNVGVLINKVDSTTVAHLANDAVRIYGWSKTSETWNGLKTEYTSAQGLLTASLPAGYSVFGVLASGDSQAPDITFSVEGQNFVDGDLISPKPTMSVLVQDESGFDFGGTPVKILLDDEELSPEEYTIFRSDESKKQATLTFTPSLDAGDHKLRVEAFDINANSATVEVAMTVAGEFGLAAIANHPNPFPDETIIAFTLTDIAERVDLDIYTVSGRLIRSFDFTDISGYHEQEWDGFDDNGNEVANGVYYLKFSAKTGDKKIEQIEKMAKLK